MFPDKKTSMGRFEQNVWPDGRKCPRRGYEYACTSRHPSMPYYAEYGKRFSVRAGTVRERSKIGYRNTAVATHLLATRPRAYPACSMAAIWGSSRVRHGSCCTGPGRRGAPYRAGPDVRTCRGGPVISGRTPKESRRADKRGKRRKTAVVGIKDMKTGTVRACPFRRLPRPAWPSLSSQTPQRMPGRSQTSAGSTTVRTTTKRPTIATESTSGGRSASTGWSRSGPWWGAGTTGRSTA